MPQWLIPFRGRNSSIAQDINFLWQDGATYIMDNHLAAAWCWFRHIQLGQRVRLLHIDMHYDCRFLPGADQLASVLTGPLDTYLDARFPGSDDVKWFAWDTYLPNALMSCPQAFQEVHFFTSHVGDWDWLENIDNMPTFHDNDVGQVNEFLRTQLASSPWVINLDIDAAFNLDDEEQALSDNTFTNMGRWIKQGIESGAIIAVTIALSPECSQGWREAERLCSLVTKESGIDFSLP